MLWQETDSFNPLPTAAADFIVHGAEEMEKSVVESLRRASEMLTAGHVTLETVIGAMLTARTEFWGEFTKLHREMLKIASAEGLPQTDEHTWRRGLGRTDQSLGSGRPDAVWKIQYGRSLLRAYAQKNQSGETDRGGGVSKVGGAMVRTALFEAAHIMPTRATRFSSLKHWALDVAKTSGHEARQGGACPQVGVVFIGCGWMRPTSAGAGPSRWHRR